ncbi:hypothetical protein BDA96_08G181200 [Sorghum bicolor]|uniref:NADH:flavin oxidoreductase/NADH oxidase N-terminal domain-containing protein n=1 Tax=Sorghum bicolor TaxID=4558 RepID=A0A921QIW0_SORBI|nr:hypothetical protein BDA96_08G181200 [Sorghum bicolor]
MEATTPLLTPYKMGKFNLAHRVVHAPVTRCRSYENMAQPHNGLYYEQRAAPGSRLLTPCTPRVPSSSARSGTRAAASNPPLIDDAEFGAPPRLEAEDIPQMVNDFRIAARNAIKAGRRSGARSW